MTEAVGTAEARYRQLETKREPFLQRAREASRLTIPSLVPPDGHSGSSELYSPYQSVGSRGVNNLASKLLLALLPPNSPFFRLMVDDFTLEQMTEKEGMRAEVEEALASIERAVMQKIESEAIRVSAFEGLKHLLVAGNVLLFLPPMGGMKVFHLDRFVVKRDPMGDPLEIIVKEDLAPDQLPDDVLAKVNAQMTDEDRRSPDKTLSLYTYVKREGTKWVQFQEIKGIVLEDSYGAYPLTKSPWIPLRYTKIDGEDYGRGFVEEYIGDLKGLETLMEAITEGTAVSSKIVFLVNPNGMTDAEELAEAENGDFIDGKADDVETLQVEKYADFRVAHDLIGILNERLGYAFLLNTSLQRSGERVTATEWNYLASELEDALGGLYSLLSQEFQLPLVRRLIHQMERAKRVPKLPEGVVSPTVVTGLEALGRGHDLQKLQAFVQDVVALAQVKPEMVEALDARDLMTRLATARGIDAKGLVKTQQQVEQERAMAAQQAQAQQMASMAERVAPEIVKQAGNVAGNRAAEAGAG